jgi:hypothetical protein
MSPEESALVVHRGFYDAVESGDVDLMASLWVDDPGVSCVHPGAVPLRGTPQVLRSWTVLMAGVAYIQFFLTDVDVETLPRGSSTPDTVVIVCTENLLSGEQLMSAEAVAGGKVVSTSILVRDTSGGRTAGDWKFWSRHSSPIAELLEED